MASAYKKDELQYAEIEVKIDVETGDIDAWRVWDVMPDEEIEDDEIQVSPERAAEMGHPGSAAGDRIRETLETSLDAGRIAAQTAKQVVLQRLREAEREAVFGEFTTKQGELVSGTVLRVEAGRRNVILDLGRTEAVLPSAEQVRPEHYRVGQRLRVYVKEVYRAAKGPQVVASRSHPELLRRLLELESPEIAKGTVEIVMMAREPGYRSKIAVISRQDGIDPIGAVVGVRGARIQNVVNELGGERIDVVRWDPNEAGFVANALSPAEVVSVRLDRETNTAFLAVPDKQFSLAIGKEGQNARLTARLTGRRIEISPESVLIRNGEDLYPPPEPNMDAMPLAPALPTLPTLPDVVAPSQAGYARPGLPGEHEPIEAPEPAPLTPEQEVLAEFAESTARLSRRPRLRPSSPSMRPRLPRRRRRGRPRLAPSRAGCASPRRSANCATSTTKRTGRRGPVAALHGGAVAGRPSRCANASRAVDAAASRSTRKISRKGSANCTATCRTTPTMMARTRNTTSTGSTTTRSDAARERDQRMGRMQRSGPGPATDASAA